MERGHFQKNRGMETEPTGGGKASLRYKFCSAPLKYEVGLFWEDKKKSFLNPPFHTNLFAYSSVP